MKKFIAAAALLSLMCAVFSMPAGLAYESDEYDDFYDLVQPQTASSVQAAASAQLSLDAQAVILVERDTGRVLYEKNATQQRAVASITKIMTMLLVVEALEAGKISLDDKVTTSEHAYSMGGSQIWLEPGEIMTVDELMRAVAVASANDAAVALAEYVSGSEESFVAAMNSRAAELGMTETVFMNSNGLDEPGHLSCAADVALMSRELLKHDIIRKYITTWLDELRGGETQLTNTNKMLTWFNGITGIKTGTTGDAGVCISASAERDGMELVAVVLGSSCSKGRFAAASDLLNYGFAYYESAAIPDPTDTAGCVRVKLGEYDYCGLYCELPESMVVEKGTAERLHYSVALPEFIFAPVVTGQQVGEMSLFCGEELIASYPICADADVDAMCMRIALRQLWQALTTM